MLNVEDGSPNVGPGGRHVTANPVNQAWGVGRGGGDSRALAHVCRGEITRVGSRLLGSKLLSCSCPLGGGLCTSDIITITCRLQGLSTVEINILSDI